MRNYVVLIQFVLNLFIFYLYCTIGILILWHWFYKFKKFCRCERLKSSEAHKLFQAAWLSLRKSSNKPACSLILNIPNSSVLPWQFYLFLREKKLSSALQKKKKVERTCTYIYGIYMSIYYTYKIILIKRLSLRAGISRWKLRYRHV